MSIEKKRIATKIGVLLAFGTASTDALAGDGWYVGADVGAAFAKSQDFKVTYENETAQYPSGDFAKVDLDDGILGGASLGYAFPSGLRPELAFERRDNDLKSIDLPASGLFNGQGGPADDVHGREVTDSAMANVWFDLFKRSIIHPYIGGGAGFARLSLRDLSYNDVDTLSKHDTVFAYQAGAGVGIDIGEHFTVSVDYRYLMTEKGKFDPLADASSPSKIKYKYQANEVMLGVRYSFGGKPEQAHSDAPAPEETVAVVDPVEGVAAPAEAEAAAAPAPAEKVCEAPKPGERISLEGCKTGDTLVLRGVTFEFNKSTLTPDAKSILDEVADELVARGDIKVEVDGHTDAKGSDRYNLQLSESRANTVKQYLSGHGVDASRMVANGFGETQPIADNDTDAGRELNRRVELKITSSAAYGAAPAAESAPAEQAAPGSEFAADAAPVAADAAPPGEYETAPAADGASSDDAAPAAEASAPAQ